TGVPPSAPLRAPSHVSSDVPPGLDAVLGRALSAQPHGRFPNAAELMTALSTVGSESAASGPAGGPPMGGGTSSPGAPRITLGKSFDVSQAAGMADSDERWLIQKDRLDYGPFSLAQVMAQIERGAFGAEHLIVDIDSGERQKIKDHPHLGQFALDAERRLEAARRARAEDAHVTDERKKS